MSSPLPDNRDQLLNRFEDAWTGSTLPCIEDYLQLQPDSPAYLPMLANLVKIVYTLF